MKYYVTVEDQLVEVELTPGPTGTTARIGDREFAIDLINISGDELFSLMVDHHSHEILVEDVEGGMEVVVAGELFHIGVQDEWERRLANIQRKSTVETGETTVKAPMPGAVISVDVAEGEPVKRGQGLVILSAMKMENQIRSPRDGKVVKLHVQAGDKVEHNAALVTIGVAPPPSS